MGAFSIQNCRVYIYRDDGIGAPKGNALWQAEMINALTTSIKTNMDYISHAGIPSDEISPGSERYTLTLEKPIESIARDFILTNALYYIRIEVWNDDRSEWSYYNCAKCRRDTSNITHAVPSLTQVTFQCESIVSADV
jgi:hypothetical protein